MGRNGNGGGVGEGGSVPAGVVSVAVVDSDSVVVGVNVSSSLITNPSFRPSTVWSKPDMPSGARLVQFGNDASVEPVWPAM